MKKGILLYHLPLWILPLVWAIHVLPALGATTATTTTILTISICGDGLINSGEQCDVPGETGVYSTTIAGRQCNTQCVYGPYCGDGILQTAYNEECDDGNNASGDFCSATCTTESPAGGGGAAHGSGGGSGGGSSQELGDTQVSIAGKAYPSATVTILKDGDQVGTVHANSSGDFSFTGNATPGTASYGFWAKDAENVRSITLNTTFDVTQGAVTNISGIFIPPTISANPATANRGGTVQFHGRTVPNVTVQVFIDNGTSPLTATSDASGSWTIPYVASGSDGAHTAKPRFEITQGGKITDSNFGTALTFNIGAAPQGQISSSDLNRDGKVNLTDFSILIFWWGGTGGDSNPPADINHNGNVGLEDFSILLFNWTG